MFMNRKLSETNGNFMQWDSLQLYSTINTFLYILIILATVIISYLIKERWEKFSLYTASFFIIVQLIAVFSLLLTPHPSKNSNLNMQLSGQEQFEVASDKNIIVLVLDMFDNTLFEKYLEESSDRLTLLKDFTYYDNADSHYFVTFPSMTHMLTGVEFDFYSSPEIWLESAWNSPKANDFYSILTEKNYKCRLYFNPTDLGYIYGNIGNLYGKFDNICEVEQDYDNNKLIYLLGKMSIYKYVPYKLKPHFEVLTSEFSKVLLYNNDIKPVGDNGEFYKKLTESGLSIDYETDNALIIEHINGIHGPFTIDERAQMVTDSNIDLTIKGLFVILDEYLTQLKGINKYNDSTIIITADHGSASYYGNGYQPIFLIKEHGESHISMIKNSAPISADDFQATILSILEEDYAAFGTSIYDWHGEDTRERSVFYPQAEDSTHYFYRYTYLTDKNELNQKVANGPQEKIPATTWAW